MFARQQKRSHRVTGRDRSSDHLLTLGQEQAVFGLEASAQADITQPHVIREPFVTRIVKDDNVCHPASLPNGGHESGRVGSSRERSARKASRAVHSGHTRTNLSCPAPNCQVMCGRKGPCAAMSAAMSEVGHGRRAAVCSDDPAKSEAAQ